MLSAVMRRRIVRFFRVLSHALCATVIFIAIFSFWLGPNFLFRGDRIHRQVHTIHRISLDLGDGFVSVTDQSSSLQYYDSMFPDTGWHFQWESGWSRDPGKPHGGVSFSLWPVALLLAVPALRAALRWFLFGLVKERHAAGLCLSCGYDLRASSDRCPECGVPKSNFRSGQSDRQ
jgi:hypothetical protein